MIVKLLDYRRFKYSSSSVNIKHFRVIASGTDLNLNYSENIALNFQVIYYIARHRTSFSTARPGPVLLRYHLETHTRSQTPHFMSYPMDMTWILRHQVYFLAKCHIHVKRYIWIYLVYPKLKKLHLVYTWYIFSWHMPCLSMSYPCHKFVRLSCAGRK